MAASDLIKFKRGTLAALQAKMTAKTGEDGCFYLTIDNGIDSSRLFIGRSDGSIVPVNQGIVKAATVSQLEQNTLAGNFQAGDFAYVEEGNILAVRSGNAWIQINNAVDTFVDGFEETVAVSNGVATITSTISQPGKADIPASHLIEGANGVTLSDVAGGVDSNEKPLPDKLVISGEHYGISRGAAASNAAAITLASDKQDSAAHDRDSSISLKGGTNVTIATPNAGEIEISAADHYVAEAGFAGKTAANGNGFELTIAQDNLDDITASFDPQIKVGVDSTKQQTLHFVGDGSATSALATLPVYTSAEIDEKLIAVNAMVYKGTVGGAGATYSALASIPSAKIGDTYKVAESITVSSTELKPGDIIIANGTEGADGNITSASLTWNIVPSGDDIYDYVIDAATHGFTLEEGSVSKGGFSLAEGTQISLTDSLDANNDRVVTIAHSNVSRSDPNATTGVQTNGSDLVVTVVDGVTTNAQGHVTAVSTKELTIKDSVVQATTVGNSVSASNNVATIGTTVGVTPYSGSAEISESSSFKLESDNLTVTAPTVAQGAAPEVKVNFVWGTF